MTKIVTEVRIYQTGKAKTRHYAEKASIDDGPKYVNDKSDRVWQVQAKL